MEENLLENVGSGYDDEVLNSVLNPGHHFILLDFLEIQLRELMEPVGDLDNEEEFVLECHSRV
jgi:hypothetical protein